MSRTNYEFNQYAAGSKVYNGGDSAPHRGPMDKGALADRKIKTEARRNALLRRMKATQSGNYMNSDALRRPGA